MAQGAIHNVRYAGLASWSHARSSRISIVLRKKSLTASASFGISASIRAESVVLINTFQTWR